MNLTNLEFDLNSGIKLTEEELGKKSEWLLEELRGAIYQYLSGHPSGIEWIDDIVYAISSHLSLDEEIEELDEKRIILNECFGALLPCLNKSENFDEICAHKCKNRFYCKTNFSDIETKIQNIRDSIEKVSDIEHRGESDDDFSDD